MKKQLISLISYFRAQSQLRRNIFFNISGTLWSAVMQFAFVPVYLRLLGIEAYGLIAFSLTLQAILVIMEMGLAPAMNYQMAKLSSIQEKMNARNFVFTSEVFSWAIGLVIGCTIAWFSNDIARLWIKADTLSPDLVKTSVFLMGGLIVLQLPQSLYTGGILGLQKHGLANGLGAFFVTLQNLGAVAVLLLVSPSISLFFAWRFFAMVLRVFFSRFFLLRCLPAVAKKTDFSPGMFKETWKFAAGMSGITITGIALTQADKVLLSKLLPLPDYGLYMLAASVANALTMITTPLFNSFFPLFTSLVSQNDHEQLRSKYHLNIQLMTLLLLPPVTILFFFSREILWLWTGDAAIAVGAAQVLAILSLGTSINGVMLVPFALQLAHGKTRLGFCIGVFLVLTMLPAVILMSLKNGMVGAAMVWVVLNVTYFLAGVPLTHRQILPGETIKVFKHVIMIFAVCFSTAAVAKHFFVTGNSVPGTMAFIFFMLIILFVIAALIGCRTRQYLLGLLQCRSV